jgi:hypothetical protein
VGKRLSGRLATVGCGGVAHQHSWKARASTAARTAREDIFFPLDRRPLGRAGAPMGDPGPPLCLAREIGIFVRVSDDDDAGVVNRFVLAQRGTRVLDLGQRRDSRSPCGPQNIQPTSGNRISRKRNSAKFRYEKLDDTLLWVRADRGSLGMGYRVTTTSCAAE